MQEYGTNGLWSTDAENPTFDAVSNPPWGYDAAKNASCTRGAGDPTSCPENPCAAPEACPTALRHDYAYDDVAYNWRALRVINATHNLMFAQWDPLYDFGVAPAPGPAPAPAPPITPGKYMASTDIVGVDDPHPCPAATNGSDWIACEATCAAQAGCLGWVLHYNPPTRGPVGGWRCCAKNTIEKLQHAPSTTTAGLLAESQMELTVAVGHVTFSELYDVARDPWQLTNLWNVTDRATKAALEEEIAARFACRGTETTPSNCE